MKIQVDLPPKGPLLTKRDYDAKLSPFDRMIAAIESMTPPTEAELEKLQSRIDMREAANSALNRYRLGDRPFTTEIAIVSRCVLDLLDEIEELETTIATQACDITEYQRQKDKPANPNYKYVELGNVMQEGDEYLSSTLGDWIRIEMESVGRKLAIAGCVMRRKVK